MSNIPCPACGATPAEDYCADCDIIVSHDTCDDCVDTHTHNLPEEATMKIGSRVSVRDQNISGTIVRWDGTRAVVLDDDRAVWMEQDDDGTLVFAVADLETEPTHRSKT